MRDNDEQKLRGWGFHFLGERGKRLDEKQDPIKRRELDEKEAFSLTTAKVGDRLWIVKLNAEGMVSRLIDMGLIPGSQLQVISTTGRSVIVALNDNRIGLSEGMAKAIACSNEPLPENFSLANTPSPEATKINTNLHLKDLSIGTRGRVIGYEKAARSYKGKLLAMGLTPGTEFTITRHALLGDPIEIQVRDFNLSLSKDEANALSVEEVKND